MWTITPNLINELRMGYTNQLNFFVPASLGQGFPAKLGWQFAKADIFPNITVNGFYNLNPNTNAVYKEHVYDPSDVVTLVKGKHILHFGGEYLIFKENSTAWGNTVGGAMTYTGIYTSSTNVTNGTGLSYADFLLGQTQSWNASVTPEFGGRMSLPQMFVQDDYKLTPNLTVNLGLRYQIQTGWSEVKGNMRVFDPTIQNPSTGTLGAMWYGSTKANGRSTLQAPVYSTFLPRVGFAWLARPDTTLRGGFGLYAYNWSRDTYGAGMGSAFGQQGNLSDQTPNVTPVVQLSGTGSNLPYLSATTNPAGFNGQQVSYNQYHAGWRIVPVERESAEAGWKRHGYGIDLCRKPWARSSIPRRYQPGAKGETRSQSTSKSRPFTRCIRESRAAPITQSPTITRCRLSFRSA